MVFQLHLLFVEGNLQVKLPTIWTDGKAEMGRVREEKRSEKIREEKEWEQRRCRCVKRWESRDSLCFSNDLWFQRVKKVGPRKRRGAIWPDERWKTARRCDTKHMSTSKCTKHVLLGALLEVAKLKTCMPLWREAHFQVKMCKTRFARSTIKTWAAKKCTPLWREAYFQAKRENNWPVRSSFRLSDVVSASCQKWAKREGFVACPKAMAGVGHVKKIRKDAFSGQETCSSEMLVGQGTDFLKKVAFWIIRSPDCLDDLAWQVQHFVWRRITLSWQAQYFRQLERKKCKMHWREAVSSALNVPVLKDV